MKLSKLTVEVLKNFNTINQGLLFKQGNVLRTMSVMKNIFASVVIPEEFPKEFAVYDLSEFLSTISLFTNPYVEFHDGHFTLSEGARKVKYFYSNPSVVVSPPDKKLAMPTPEATFTLSRIHLEQIMKAAAVMKLKDLQVSKSGLCVFNRNSVGNQYTVDVEVNTENSEFILKVENLKLLPADYEVAVTSKGISHFKSLASAESFDAEYFIAIETE